MVHYKYLLSTFLIAPVWCLRSSLTQNPLLRVPGHNDLYVPNPQHPVPGKVPLEIDESIHYFEKHVNNDQNGTYKRSSCPAVNMLANRGYINRNGKHITFEELAQTSRDIFNFGDDNVSGTRNYHIVV